MCLQFVTVSHPKWCLVFFFFFCCGKKRAVAEIFAQLLLSKLPQFLVCRLPNRAANGEVHLGGSPAIWDQSGYIVWCKVLKRQAKESINEESFASKSKSDMESDEYEIKSVRFKRGSTTLFDRIYFWVGFIERRKVRKPTKIIAAELLQL